VTNQPVVEAGLRMLDAGGDFADGAIACEGEWLGAEEFASFDKEAVSLLRQHGRQARLLS
jgi:predicted nucleic-acid-binding protein